MPTSTVRTSPILTPTVVLLEGWVPDEEYITVAQAAQLSGLSARHIARLLQRGEIEGIKPGHDWLLRPSAVMAYLKQERKPGRRPKHRQS